MLLLWMLGAVALLALAHLAPGFEVRSPGMAVVVAMILALTSTVIQPLLLLLTPSMTPLVVGLVTLLLMAVLLRFTGEVADALVVRGWQAALLGALVLALLSASFRLLTL